MLHLGWVFIVDERCGRLLRAGRSDRGTLRMRDEADLRNTWEEHQHGRPSARSGRNGKTYASIGHEDETMRARFAKDVSTWLDERTRDLGIERVAVFAPPRFMGALRRAWSPRLIECIEERQGDLAHLPAGDLARHPEIMDTVREV